MTRGRRSSALKAVSPKTLGTIDRTTTIVQYADIVAAAVEELEMTLPGKQEKKAAPSKSSSTRH